MDVFWKLRQESFISLILNAQTFVFVPFVFEECLYVEPEFFWDLFAVIKSLDERKETIKFFRVFHLTIERLHFLDHVVEFTNDVAEDRIPKQYDNGTSNSFEIVDGVVVTEAYSRERRESKICHDDCNTTRFKFVDIEMVYEIILDLQLSLSLGHFMNSMVRWLTTSHVNVEHIFNETVVFSILLLVQFWNLVVIFIGDIVIFTIAWRSFSKGRVFGYGVVGTAISRKSIIISIVRYLPSGLVQIHLWLVKSDTRGNIWTSDHGAIECVWEEQRIIILIKERDT